MNKTKYSPRVDLLFVALSISLCSLKRRTSRSSIVGLPCASRAFRIHEDTATVGTWIGHSNVLSAGEKSAEAIEMVNDLEKIDTRVSPDFLTVNEIMYRPVVVSSCHVLLEYIFCDTVILRRMSSKDEYVGFPLRS